jgi:copper chaperone CopZ
MVQVKVKVGGMNCNHCKINVETGLKKISGIDTAIVDIINGEVTIKGSKIELDSIKATVEDLGYFYDGEIPA